MEHAVFYYALGVELGVDVSKAGVEDGEDVLQGYGLAEGVEFEGYGVGGGRVVVWGWGEVAGGVSMRLAIELWLDLL